MQSPAKRYLTRESVLSEKYGDGTVGEMTLVNLSQSGARLRLVQNGRFSPGDLLRLSIDLIKIKKKRHVNAEVVWAEGREIGVSFVRPEDIWLRLIAQR